MTRRQLKHIAYCGLDCTVCPAYIATALDSDEKRRETAELWNKAEWSKKYNYEFKSEDINCYGCLSEIANPGCEIRLCGRGKGLLNCAYCGDYICAELDKVFQKAPMCKEMLDGIKQGIK